MALSTTLVKKVKASNVDLHDPKQILKTRHLTHYQHLSEANTMTTSEQCGLLRSSVSSDQGKAGNMEKEIKDMTQKELLSAIADEGDKNRASGKKRPPPSGNPSTWKFEGRLKQLLDAYNAKFVPEEPYLADDVEHFRFCNGPEDGLMIECSNGSACLMNWFHFECIGMGIDDVPDEQEDWFCKRCIDNKMGKLRKNAPKSIFGSIVKKPNADRIKNYAILEQTVGKKKGKNFAKNQKSRAKGKEMKKQQKTLTISTSPPLIPSGPLSVSTTLPLPLTPSGPLTINTTPSGLLGMSTPSPGSPAPWTAELDKTFMEDPEVVDTYSLRSVTSAKAALRLQANHHPTNTALTEDKDDDDDSEVFDAAPEPTHRRNRGTWTQEEKAHLIACVTESKAAGHCGELLWNDVGPRMLARGVERPVGGMKNTWLRGLREQTGIDERRRQNADKMTTAIQTPKKPKKAEEAEKAAVPDAMMEGTEGTEEAAAARKQEKEAEEKEAEEEKEKTKKAEEKKDAIALAMMPSEPIARRARAGSV